MSRITSCQEEQIHTRESGIELLKILAMFIIVISHVAQLAGTPGIGGLSSSDAIIDYDMATEDFQHLTVSFFRYFGGLGNNIFLACSCWFLADSSHMKRKKILHMVLDVWILSVLFLLLFLAFKLPLTIEAIIGNIFPNTMSTYWFITCYILLYAIHPYLNLVIKSMSQREHIIAVIVGLLLYSFLPLIHHGLFFVSSLIEFVVVYFLVVYIKRFFGERINNRKKLLLAWIVSILVLVVLFIATNLLGQRVSFFSNKLQHWGGNCSPFLLAIAITSLLLFKSMKFYSHIINFISSFSLYVFVIHINVIFRNPVVGKFFVDAYARFGHLLLLVFLCSLFVFIISNVIALIYRLSLYRIVRKL